MFMQERMQRNRESAHQSRQRKKMQVDELSRRCDTLQQNNTYLSGPHCNQNLQPSHERLQISQKVVVGHGKRLLHVAQS